MAKRKADQEPASEGEEWSISESATERILDLLIALIFMCAILCWCLVTFSVRDHIVLIVMVPLLCYFTLSSPGTRLRLRERRSMLLFTDIVTVVLIGLCCLFTDYSYGNETEYMIPRMVFGIVSAVLLCFYIGRAKFMYKLIVPAVFVIHAVMFTFWNPGSLIGLLLTFMLPIPYCLFTFKHPYYFGYGRVKVKGKYRRYPESVAKRMRAKQAQEHKAERRARVKENSKRL